MFINKATDGKHNICVRRIAELRKEKKWSLNELAKLDLFQHTHKGEIMEQKLKQTGIDIGENIVSDE